MPVSKYKKRYNVSLNPEIVERFQKLAKLHGLPPIFMSLACQSGIESFAEVLQLAKDNGVITQSDIFMLLAKQTKKYENGTAEIMLHPVTKSKE